MTSSLTSHSFAQLLMRTYLVFLHSFIHSCIHATLLLLLTSGLLQAHPGLPAHQRVEAAGLLPRPHDSQHLPAGPAARLQPGAGLLPPPPRLQLGLRRHHGVRLLRAAIGSDVTASRTVTRSLCVYVLFAVSIDASLMMVVSNHLRTCYIMENYYDDIVAKILPQCHIKWLNSELPQGHRHVVV